MVACPTCGKDLTYLAQYDRWYCFAEAKYAPKEFVAPVSVGLETTSAPSPGTPESHDGHFHCPTCSRELTYIAQYNRYYCYTDGTYAPKDIVPVGTETAPQELPRAESVTPVQPPDAAILPGSPDLGSRSAAASSVTQGEAAVIASRSASESVPSSAPQPSSVPQAVSEQETPVAGVRPRPKLVRISVMKAKKTKLMEWASAYGLDPTGTRNQVRDRLLSYLDEHPSDVVQEGSVEAEGLPLADVAAAPLRLEPSPAPPGAGTSPLPAELSLGELEEEPEDTDASEVLEELEKQLDFPVVEAKPEFTPPRVAPEVKPDAEASPVIREPKIEPAPAEVPMTPAPTAPPVAPTPTPAPAPVAAPPAASPAAPARTASQSPVPALGRVSLAAPVQAPLRPEPPKAEPEKPLPCPNCGKDLTYIARYDRLYCYSCGNYAPKGYGKEIPARGPAPEPVRIVEVPKPAAGTAAPTVIAPKVAPKIEHPCPTCGRELRYVREYDRWWCDAERKYAARDFGKVRNACPTCGKELSYIKNYDRWYCYAENKYAPKTYVAAVPTVTVTPPIPLRQQPTVAAAPAARPATQVVVSPAARAAHTHGKPTAGIALSAIGFSMLVIWYIVLVFGVLLFPPLGPSGLVLLIVAILGLVGIILAMAGVIAGLWSVRAR